MKRSKKQDIKNKTTRHKIGLLMIYLAVFLVIALFIWNPKYEVGVTDEIPGMIPEINPLDIDGAVITTTTMDSTSAITSTTTPESDSDKDKEVIIEIIDKRFEPKEIIIDIGTTVTWINKDVQQSLDLETYRPHIIAAHYNVFRSSRLGLDETFSHTFNEIGTYTYVDPIYRSSTNSSYIRGKIIVVDELAKDLTGRAITHITGLDEATVFILKILLIIIAAAIITGRYICS